jgi:nucleotide-binding universal stress UspA family protein
MTTLARIVVGIDGEGGGWEALALAQRLARPDACALTIVCAYPALAVAHATFVWPHIHDEQDAQRALAAARLRLPADPSTHLVSVAGATPGAVLQRVAADTQARLVVVGSSRRAPLGRVLGGDVVTQTLDDPPCAVAVAPLGLLDAGAPLAHIGVAVDGTRESLAAVRWAGALTCEPRGMRTLELIHVDQDAAEPAPAPNGVLRHLGDRHRFETFAALEPVGRLRSRVLVTWTEAAGAVVPALVRLSSGLDLLVLGTHGRGPIGRLLHGEVARDAAQCAHCPVIVVPASAVRESTVRDSPLRRMGGRASVSRLTA